MTVCHLKLQKLNSSSSKREVIFLQAMIAKTVIIALG